jgi:hypothetical protein
MYSLDRTLPTIVVLCATLIAPAALWGDGTARSNAIPSWAAVEQQRADAARRQIMLREVLISGGHTEQKTGLPHITISDEPLYPPPEAWQNMDTRSPIDPRILEFRRRSEEAAKKRKILDQAKAKHRDILWNRVRRSKSYDPTDPGVIMAVEDVAHYFALSQTASREEAKAWLDNRLFRLQTAHEKLKNKTQPIAVAHDTIIAAAALGAGESGSGNMAQQTQQMIIAMRSHISALRSMTGVGYEPPKITTP